MSKPEHSWRDFYDIHPAAAFFHGFSNEEQLEELADDIEKQQRLLDPIHTASVFGKTFMIDGISRADAAEKTGRQIVDEKGNWIGMLDGHVVHHPGKTDEEVWDIVISLNNKRRHYTDGQKAVMASELAKRLEGKMSFPPVGEKLGLEGKGMPEGSFRSIDPKLSKRGRSEGRPSKGATAATKQAAKMTGASKRSVERVQQIEREAPDKIAAIKAGKLSPSKAASELPSKPRKAKTNGDGKKQPKRKTKPKSQAWLWFGRLLRNNYPEDQQPEAVLGIVEGYLTKRDDRDRKDIVPRLDYPDGTNWTLKEAIDAYYQRKTK